MFFSNLVFKPFILLSPLLCFLPVKLWKKAHIYLAGRDVRRMYFKAVGTSMYVIKNLHSYLVTQPRNTLGQIWSITTKSYHSNFNGSALKSLSHKFKEIWTLCEQKIANYIQSKSLDVFHPNIDQSVKVFLMGAGKIKTMYFYLCLQKHLPPIPPGSTSTPPLSLWF